MLPITACIQVIDSAITNCASRAIQLVPISSVDFRLRRSWSRTITLLGYESVVAHGDVDNFFASTSPSPVTREAFRGTITTLQFDKPTKGRRHFS